jgi:peptidyl-prolyl cis-trans isomerase SurA
MRSLFSFRQIIEWSARLLLAAATAAMAAQIPGPTGPTVVDRVVAVVNNRAILWSDVISEQRFAILDPKITRKLTPHSALQRLISRTLIQQQIHQEDVDAAQPSDEEVLERLHQVRIDLPACAAMNCATDAGWQKFLTANYLTAKQVEDYLRLRLEILRFIEFRFRQGIRISPQDTEAYYRDKLVPQYPQGAAIPPLTEVAPRIEEILLEEQVNAYFTAWLDNLRKQGDVEVLDPTLESGTDTATAGKGEQ